MKISNFFFDRKIDFSIKQTRKNLEKPWKNRNRTESEPVHKQTGPNRTEPVESWPLGTPMTGNPRNRTGNREPGSVNREPVGTGTGMNWNRSEPEPVCTVLYSTVQYLLFVIEKNQKRNTNAGGAPRRGDARPPRSCYVFVFFLVWSF